MTYSASEKASVLFYPVAVIFGPKTNNPKVGTSIDASHVDNDGGLRGHLRFYTPTLPLSLSLSPPPPPPFLRPLTF